MIIFDHFSPSQHSESDGTTLFTAGPSVFALNFAKLGLVFKNKIWLILGIAFGRGTKENSREDQETKKVKKFN